MLNLNKNYDTMYSKFKWHIPEFYNIGLDVCDKWANKDPEKLALINVLKNSDIENYSFNDIKKLSNQTANMLKNRGISKGDRVSILLAQSPETAYSHVAIYKLGAIAVPLFTLFGEEAISYRLKNSGSKAVITDIEGAIKIASISAELPDLEHVFIVNGELDNCINFHQSINNESHQFSICNTRSEDPALIIYTSGTTGQPKGTLHAHRMLLGHLPGFELSHNGLMADDNCFWTPADWAWIGGLYDVLMPSWHHGIPVVAHRFSKFSAESAFQLIQDHNIRNIFFPPTALKIMRSIEKPTEKWDLNVHSIASGGESLGIELLEWGRHVFGVTINEFYGQTECNIVISSCHKIFTSRLYSIGLPVPGHIVAIVDMHGIKIKNGIVGNIAVKAPDPVMFLKYWKNPVATLKKYINGWLITGDLGRIEDDGSIVFIGRGDDVITSSGYRIGPGEIENCILSHASVEHVGVIGVPDDKRTEVVKACVVLKPQYIPSQQLTLSIQNHVKNKLAAHEYPRLIEYMNELPMTNTGKILRRKLRECHTPENIKQS